MADVFFFSLPFLSNIYYNCFYFCVWELVISLVPPQGFLWEGVYISPRILNLWSRIAFFCCIFEYFYSAIFLVVSSTLITWISCFPCLHTYNLLSNQTNICFICCMLLLQNFPQRPLAVCLCLFCVCAFKEILLVIYLLFFFPLLFLHSTLLPFSTSCNNCLPEVPWSFLKLFI